MASGTTAQRSSATASAHPWSIHPLQRHRLRRRRLPPPPRRKSCVAITSAAGTQQSLSGVSTMQEAYDLLTDRIMHHLQRRGDSRSAGKYLVGVAGVPGSGKSSLAREVVARLNKRGTLAVNVPMDGFHYFKHQLDTMPDPRVAHARRGAEWTFDASAFVTCLRQLKTGRGVAPSFDHGVGDPRPGMIEVDEQHQVLVAEGNYLLLAAEPWCHLQPLWDDTWYIDCEVDVAMQRVFERQTGNGVAAEVSRRRVATNDRPNAELVVTTKDRAAVLVPTLPLQYVKK